MSENKFIDSRSIELIFENYEYDPRYRYLFFLKDNKYLNLDDFRYESDYFKNVSQIKVSFGKERQAFLIDERQTYDIYYKEKPFMKIEPDDYTFSNCGTNNEDEGRHEYLIFNSKKGKLREIPDNFTCKYNGNPLEKVKFNGRECFEITDISEYFIYKDDKFYHKIVTELVWEYKFKDIYNCNICFDYTEKIFPIPNCQCSAPVCKACIYKSVRRYEQCPFCRTKITMEDLKELNKAINKINKDLERKNKSNLISEERNQASSSSTTKPIITNLKRKHGNDIKGKSRDDSLLDDFCSTLTDSFSTLKNNYFSDDFYSSLYDAPFTRKRARDFNNHSLEYELKKEKLQLDQDLEIQEIKFKYHKLMNNLDDEYLYKMIYKI
ncbi:8301_t:CDS:2 [Scutellospora calospora]|uniref:8301_t:CDS:1 n=1 Tax=Scutellospora calospora TaxID=85575 RepID=A0ACA9JUW8_9GLOM|nr:8301_t:CDS:2 [Scutellospora calospora]